MDNIVNKRIALIASGLVVLLAVVTAVVLSGKVGATPTPAPAAAPDHAPVVQESGKLTALHADGFTLTLQNTHSYTVTVSPQTWIVVNQGGRRVNGTLADLQVGDTLQVGGNPATGTLTDGGTLAARMVNQNPPAATGRKAPATPGTARTPGAAGARAGAQKTPAPRLQPKYLAGALAPALGKATVQSVAGGVLTLAVDSLGAGKSPTTTVTLRTDANTVVLRGGPAAVADLQPGDQVTVFPRQAPAALPAAPAAPAASATPAAGVTPSAAPARKPGSPTGAAPVAGLIYVPGDDRLVSGRVPALDGATFKVIAFANTYTFTVDGSTVFKLVTSTGTAPASKSDLTPGSKAYVYSAKPTDTGPVPAGVVIIEPPLQP